MSFFQMIRSKRTWIGILIFAVSCILLEAFGAQLTVKGILPTTAERWCVWCSIAIAAFGAGLYLMNGKAVLPAAGTVWVLIMLLLMTAGWILPGRIDWGETALVVGGIVLSGLILAGLLKSGGSKKKHRSSGKGIRQNKNRRARTGY